MPVSNFLRSIDVSGVGSGVVGPGWAGLSGTTAIWGTTTSGSPKRWVDYLFGGTSNANNGLFRTDPSEQFRNGKARVRALTGEVNVGLMARGIGTITGGSRWQVVLSNVNMGVQGKVANVNVFNQSVSSIPNIPAHKIMELSVVDNSDTQTTVRVKIWNGDVVTDMSVETIATSPVFDQTWVFTTTGSPLRSAGAWGMGADNGCDYGEFYIAEDAVELSATATLGEVFKNSFYATVTPVGGLSTNTITAHLSTTSGFTPSEANEISGISGTTLSASGLTAGKIYYLKFKVVNGAEEVITDQITVTTKPSNHYTIMARGDSLTDGYGATAADDAPLPVMVDLLEAQGYAVTGLEEGVFGDSTAGSLSSLSGVITRSAFAKVDVALVMLGSNDPGQSISTATSQSNLISIIDQLAAGVTSLQGIMLNQQPWANDRDVSGYIATHAAVIAGTTTTLDYLGNQTMYAAGQSNYPGWYADGVHLNDTGYAYMADLWADTFVARYEPDYGLSPLALSATTLQVEVGSSRPIRVRVVSSLDSTGQAGVTVTASSNNAGVTIGASKVTDADGYATFSLSDGVSALSTTVAGTTATITFGYATMTATCAVEVVALGAISGAGESTGDETLTITTPTREVTATTAAYQLLAQDGDIVEVQVRGDAVQSSVRAMLHFKSTLPSAGANGLVIEANEQTSRVYSLSGLNLYGRAVDSGQTVTFVINGTMEDLPNPL